MPARKKAKSRKNTANRAASRSRETSPRSSGGRRISGSREFQPGYHSNEPLVFDQPSAETKIQSPETIVINRKAAKRFERTSIATIILGICALIFGWIPFFGWIIDIAAIILGTISFNSSQPGSQERVISVVAIILGVIPLLFSVSTVIILYLL